MAKSAGDFNLTAHLSGAIEGASSFSHRHTRSIATSLPKRRWGPRRCDEAFIFPHIAVQGENREILAIAVRWHLDSPSLARSLAWFLGCKKGEGRSHQWD